MPPRGTLSIGWIVAQGPYSFHQDEDVEGLACVVAGDAVVGLDVRYGAMPLLRGELVLISLLSFFDLLSAMTPTGDDYDAPLVLIPNTTILQSIDNTQSLLLEINCTCIKQLYLPLVLRNIRQYLEF